MFHPALKFYNQTFTRIFFYWLEVFKRTESDGWGSDGLHYGLTIVGLGDLGDLHHDGSLPVLPDAGQGHTEQEGSLGMETGLFGLLSRLICLMVTTRTLMKPILIPWKSFLLIINYSDSLNHFYFASSDSGGYWRIDRVLRQPINYGELFKLITGQNSVGDWWIKYSIPSGFFSLKIWPFKSMGNGKSKIVKA